jgi:hypothetical protein
MSRLPAAVIAALLLTTALCPAQDVDAGAGEEGLRFHLSFDSRDVAADYARGNPRSTTFTESLELRGVEGISGPGFQIAAGERLDYEREGNFALDRGSICMWIKPVNWQGRNDRFEVFFHARSSAYVMHLYKYATPNHLFAYINVGGETVVARTAADDWKPGEWHHIAATWQPDELRLYLDGEMMHAKTIEEPLDLAAAEAEGEGGFMAVTPPKLWEKGFDVNDRTVVDEVKIWDRVLDDGEIRREYLTHAPEDADAEPLDVQWEIAPAAGEVLLEVDAFRLLGDGGEELAILAGLADAAGEVVAEQTAPTEDGAASFALAFGELAPGEYTLRVAALGADGTERAAVTESFQRPEVTWEDAPTFEGVVPEPWTPIEWDAGALGVWGRTHEFGAGPLPTAVVAQEREVLAGAVRLAVDGEEPVWSEAEVVAQAPDALEREGAGAAGEVALEWRTRMEYDGMLRCDLALEPAGERAEIHALELALPVSPEQGRYVLAPTMVDWTEDTIALGWRDMVWLTGREAGICWFAESDANWVNPEGATPITVERGEDGTTLTLTMIGEPVTIEGPVRYTFGLQATPTRPLPDDWRNLNLAHPTQVDGSRASLVSQGGGAFVRNAYLEMRTDEKIDVDAVMERWEERGIVLPYSTPTFLADHTPEWDFYRRQWRNSERHTYVGYEGWDGVEYALQATCPRSDFSELMVHWASELMANYPQVDGIYYDCCDAKECRNDAHGCGGVDVFGRSYATHPIFDLRDVLRRVYTIAHEHGGIVMNHAHSRFYPPMHGFGDYWFPGEQYTTRLGEDLWYYTDQIPPEVWQIELSSQVRGVGVCFLPEFGRGTDKRYQFEEVAPSRSLLAACMLHDVPSSGHYIHPDAIEEVWTIYDRFWLSDATFHGYWEADCPVQADGPLQASAYVSEDAIVVVVSNLTPEAAEGTLRIDPETVEFPEGWTLTEQPSGEAVKAPIDAVPVSVGARDFRVFAVR